jgi:hypothetical protein
MCAEPRNARSAYCAAGRNNRDGGGGITGGLRSRGELRWLHRIDMVKMQGRPEKTIMPVETTVADHHSASTFEHRDIDSEIYAAQIHAVYQHMPMILADHVVNSALVALLLTRQVDRSL